MALTRVTTSVISSNVITSDIIGNNIIQERHIQAGALTSNAFAPEARADFVETRLNANLDIVQSNVVSTQSNVNTVQTNVNSVHSNVEAVSANAINSATYANNQILSLDDRILETDSRQATNVNIFTTAFTGTNAAIAAITDGTTPFTGPVTMQDALTVQGNLIVVGAQVDLGIGSARIDDATILLAANTPADQGLPTDAGVLINRGANDNVFFGFATYGDHIDFIFTEAPASNAQHYPTAYIDVHANSFGIEGTHNATFTGFHHADYPTTGIYMPAGEGTIEFAAGGVNVANVTTAGNLFLSAAGIIHGPSAANTLDLDDDELGDRQNSITLRSLQSVGIFLDSNDSETGNFLNIYDGTDDPNSVGIDDGIFSVRDDGNVFVSHDINIVGNANVAGVNLLSNDYVTYTRLNANLNSTSDNIAAVISNTNVVQDNVAALTGGATLLIPFTNVNTAVGTSNVFFIGKDCGNDSNVLVVTLDGIRQHPTIDWIGNYSNDTVQFVDATIPSGTIVSITSLT